MEKTKTTKLQDSDQSINALTPKLEAKPVSMRDVAYNKLKDAIQTLKLEPGKIMSDSELARWLGMSRTPIREALALLEKEMFITRIPNRGVLIRSLTIDEVVHIIQMREALDGMAARLAAESISETVLDELKNAFENMFQTSGCLSDEHSALSKRLHTTIIRAAGNPFLENAMDNLMGSFERAWQYSWRLWKESRDTEDIALRRYREHMEIIGALRSRDPKRAEAVARKHVVTGTKDLFKAISRGK